MDENEKSEYETAEGDPVQPRWSMILPVVCAVLVVLFMITTMICMSKNISFFAFGLKDDADDQIDRVNGYYVRVYKAQYCEYTGEDGQTNYVFGNSSDITDFNWKHEELLGVDPYKRFLCFSKYTEPEHYFLKSEDGSVLYGFMQVVRSPNGTIHYYYRRVWFANAPTTVSPYQFDENITFNYNGETIELEDYYYFSSETDFTTGENVLYMKDEPICFK